MRSHAVWLFVLLLSACAISGNRPLAFVTGDGPAYPQGAREQRIEGWVVVEYTVDANGDVHSPRVVEASPPAVFDQAALDAVAQWRYTPRYVKGEPRETVGVRSTVTFKLSDGDEYAEY